MSGGGAGAAGAAVKGACVGAAYAGGAIGVGGDVRPPGEYDAVAGGASAARGTHPATGVCVPQSGHML